MAPRTDSGPSSTGSRHDADERRWSALMARAQNGERHAYDQLMHELADAVEAYLRSRFGPLDILEDCVQEALLAVHRARHTYDPRRAFRPWLFTLVKHRTIDVLRRAGPRTASADAVQPVAHGPDPASLLDGARVLRKLKPSEAQALALTKIEGLSMAEAGARCGCSESAMKVRVHRALRAARAMMDVGT